jgi:metal-responsive CopG/Arc/MetJ family transcriptional regulator
MSRNVLVRDVPDELIAEVDRFAKRSTGAGGKPSRDAAIRSLLRAGLREESPSGTVRGDGRSAVKREA